MTMLESSNYERQYSSTILTVGVLKLSVDHLVLVATYRGIKARLPLSVYYSVARI